MLRNITILMLFAAYEDITVCATMFAYCQNGGHEPEVVIHHHLRHLAGPRKELFYSLRI